MGEKRRRPRCLTRTIPNGKEILSGMAEWRQQHPKATFREIEQETMKRVGQFQARMMEEIAQASQAAEWDESEPPRCPECGDGEARGARAQAASEWGR